MNNKLILIGLIMISTALLSGCSMIRGGSIFNSLHFGDVTTNGTVYDPSRSFELVRFCNAASFDYNPDPSLLDCGVGNITDVHYSNLTGNWSCMSCAFDATKCATTTTNNITLYNGLNLSSEHIISADFEGAFTVMCCNNEGVMCYRPLIISAGVYESCGAGYNELVGSITYNNITGNWSVTSCLNGFR